VVVVVVVVVDVVVVVIVVVAVVGIVVGVVVVLIGRTTQWTDCQTLSQQLTKQTNTSTRRIITHTTHRRRYHVTIITLYTIGGSKRRGRSGMIGRVVLHGCG
jgi:uncharacterized membrane protein affecting hemolysin expression